MHPPAVDGTADLPAPVATALTAFVSSAAASLESDLRSIVLFGSGAENRLRPTSDVNLAVILRAFDAPRIATLSETVVAARAAVRLNVMWLLESEIPHAAEAFAVKFADILRRRRVLWGSDPFESLSVPRAMAIARLRQVLMLLAGHETTSLALSWTYYLLSQHPEVEQGIADEVERVIGDGPPGFEHLDRLICTRRAIEESLRLYPPAWGFSRRALGDDEIGGYRVPKGALVFLIPFVIHRRPALWPNPDRFDPGRFTPEQEAQRPRFAYIPFGGGPRGCIGNQFAMVEAQLIVAAIAQRYRIELMRDQDIRPEPLITLRPAPGIRAIVRKRAPRGVVFPVTLSRLPSSTPH